MSKIKADVKLEFTFSFKKPKNWDTWDRHMQVDTIRDSAVYHMSSREFTGDFDVEDWHED